MISSGKVRSTIISGLSICLILIALIIIGATQSMMPSGKAHAQSPTDGLPPVIQVFEADPMVLDTADSTAVYTFKVKNATNIAINEAGTNIKNISNPSGATLNGTADGLPASAIPTDDSGKFISIITASNDNGSDTAELTLSLAANLIPAGESGEQGGETGQRKPQWGPLTRAPITSTLSNVINDEPEFFKCPSDCDHCLKPDEAVSAGYTQRCSEELCYYSPDKQQKWYCYKPTPGWCCADFKVFQNTKDECNKLGGYWSLTQAEALERCQPLGWCCMRDGQILQGTKSQCTQMAGTYFDSLAVAKELCQPPCYCCLRGQVYQTTQGQCLQSGGNCYSSLAQAYERCQLESSCWCCFRGQVYQTTQAQCMQSGGACYSTQSQAAAACYQEGPRTPYLK